MAGTGEDGVQKAQQGAGGGAAAAWTPRVVPSPPPPTRPRSSRGLWLKPTATQGAMVSAIRGVGGHHLWGVAEGPPDQTQRARRPAHSSGSRDVVDHRDEGLTQRGWGKWQIDAPTRHVAVVAGGFKAQLATTRGATRLRPAAAAQLRWRGQQSIRSLHGRGGGGVGTHV